MRRSGPKPKLAETDVAAPIVAWLESELDADVYQEVERRGSIFDIVAVLPGVPERVMIVETKTSLNMALLDQAWERLPHAHYVSVGVPFSGRRSTFASRVLHDYGIGLLSVNFDCGKHVKQEIEPRLHRWAQPARIEKIRALRNRLCPEQKVEARAGSCSGGYWTPFKSTVRQVEAIVKERPGISMKDLIESHGRFHYASPGSARSTLVNRIRRGIVGAVRIFYEGRKIRLYLKDHPIFVEKGDGVEAEFEEAIRCMT